MASLGKKGITHHRYIVNFYRKEPPICADEDYWLWALILVLYGPICYLFIINWLVFDMSHLGTYITHFMGSRAIM